MGGSFYGDFLKGGYVAIGYNEVTLADLKTLDGDNTDKDKLKLIFHNRYPDNSGNGYAAAQLYRFYNEVKDGDVVLIPSTGGRHAAIGVIRGDMYEASDVPPMDSKSCYFKKRFRVDWKDYRRKEMLPQSLQLAFSSRHIISDISDYAHHIDGMINDFYVKDNMHYLILRIRTQKDVSFDDFLNLRALTLLVEDFCESEKDIPINMKIQMESPGWLKLSSPSLKKLFTLGVFITFLCGGGVRFTKKDGLNIYTNGIPDIINNYLDRKADRQLIDAAVRSIDSLQIKEPDDLKPIIELMQNLDDRRNDY